METVRAVIDSEQLVPIMALPESLRHREVEVIVIAHEYFTVSEKFFPPENGIKGILKQYANPALTEQEKDAWEMAVREKFGESP